jgi:hypothetical protein
MLLLRRRRLIHHYFRFRQIVHHHRCFLVPLSLIHQIHHEDRFHHQIHLKILLMKY